MGAKAKQAARRLYEYQKKHPEFALNLGLLLVSPLVSCAQIIVKNKKGK